MRSSGTIINDRNHSFQSLPAELIVKIIIYLPLHDLASCRRVNYTINSIIESSQCIQHYISAATAGITDNPESNLSLPARRDALTRRQEAWDTCKPQHITTHARSFPLFNLSRKNGIYFKLHPLQADDPHSVAYCLPPRPDQHLDGEWSFLTSLRREDHYETIAFATCLECDLVAVGIRLGNVPPQTTGHFYTHTLAVDLLSFSLGGGEHPSAREPGLFVKTVSRDDGIDWEMSMAIHMNLLGVFLKPRTKRPKSELHIFDWKTGQKITYLQRQGIDAFQFLPNEVVLVTNRSPATLELFVLPVLGDEGGPAPMTKVAALGLPSVDRGCRISNVSFYSLPTKNAVIHKHQPHDSAVHTKAFIDASSDDIIVVCMNIESRKGYDNLTLIVHSSVLLRHISTHVDLHIVPWHQWGPTSTRCCDGSIYPIISVCGQRCIVSPQPGTWEIWDFNQYRVKRLGRDFVMETVTGCLSVEVQESYAKSWGIQGGVCTSLPYVKHKPKELPKYSIVFLDCDRIFGERVWFYSLCTHGDWVVGL